MSIAIVSLLVIGVFALVVIPIMVRVVGEAGKRNEDRPGGEGDENDDRRSSSAGRR